MRWYGLSCVGLAVFLVSGVAFGAGAAEKAFVEGVEFERVNHAGGG